MVKIMDKYEYPPEIDLQEFVDDSIKSKALSSSQVLQDWTKTPHLFVNWIFWLFSLSIRCMLCWFTVVRKVDQVITTYSSEKEIDGINSMIRLLNL